MAYGNYLIESEVVTFAAIQAAINRLLLDGLDVRLTPVSRNRALIPRHILDAIRTQYGIDPWQYLQSNGVRLDKFYPVSDEDALALVTHRAIGELDAQPNIVVPAVVVPAVGGVAWHLANINVPPAWALLGGPDSIAWTCKVGQIDTGFTRHPALGYTGVAGVAGVAGAAGATSPWLLEAQCRNFYSPDPASGNEPGDATGEDPRSGPFWGHGTRIGAAISGWHPGGDGGTNFYGCAPKVPHVVVRISNTVWINDQLSALADALNYLVDVVQVDVINLSMGAGLVIFPKKTKAAVNNAYEKGVIFICAGGQHVPRVVAPACFGRTIAVGGTTSKDQVWAKASIGPEIDWSAPAADIRRATIEKKTGPYVYRDNGDGTSYATALSTGVAALWLTHRAQEINLKYRKTWMRVCAFREIAKATARVPPVWGPGVAGAGILNAEAVLGAALPDVSALKEPPI